MDKGGSMDMSGSQVVGEGRKDFGAGLFASSLGGGDVATARGGGASLASSDAMSDNRFNESLDALMAVSDSWMGTAAYSQPTTTPSAPPSSSSSTLLGLHPRTQQLPQHPFPGGLMTSSFGVPLPTNAATSSSTLQIPGLGTITLPAGFSAEQFQGLTGLANGPLSHQQMKLPQVTFSPIQSASSEVEADDLKRKPSRSKRTRSNPSSVSAVSEDEGDRSRRRHDRNQREQQRSQQITHQIGLLRDVLAAANVNFKADKYSTLVTVAEFIKSLQERVELLDSEHKKLLNTIVQTTNSVNGQHLPQEGGGGGPATDIMKVSDVFDDGKISPLQDEDSPVFVNSLDYKAVFDCCPVASAITSIDGRFLDCNPDFEELSGYAKGELVNSIKDDAPPVDHQPQGADTRKPPPRSMSLFNVVRRDNMETVFVAMSEMLKMPFPGGAQNQEVLESDHWSGVVSLVRQEGAKVKLGVCLVRGSQGNPKFFTCTMLPVEGPLVIADAVTSAAAVG